MTSRWSKFSIFALILTLAAACAAPATSAPTATPADTAVPATAAPTAAPTAAATAAGGQSLTVFAAASLTDAFNAIGKNFQAANPGTTVTFNFAGSQQLAQQIGQGAPADVFASANNAQMAVLIKSGQVISGSQRTFVRNRLVVIYPTANPGGLTKLQDLAKPGLKVVLADKTVPVGGYALDFLTKASASPDFTPTFSPTVLANVVSYETDVKQVLAKVSLGEADAGIVYTTDITADAAGKVGRLDIPDALNTIATYPIAAIKGSPNASLAQKFVDYVLSPDGQMVLVQFGFIPTTGNASGGAATAAPLAIAGLVDKPTTLSAADFGKLTQVSVKATDKSGTEQTYTGVAITTLLQTVSVQASATNIIFTGGDGYTATVKLTDVAADPNAIIAIDANGAFRNIIPTMAPKVWVKGLIKMELQ